MYLDDSFSGGDSGAEWIAMRICRREVEGSLPGMDFADYHGFCIYRQGFDIDRVEL